LVPFTVQYLFLRTFYALEANRTTFFLQLVISGINVVAAVLVVFALHRPSLVATGLAASYSLAYLVGVIVSYYALRRRLPDLRMRPVLRLCVRLLVAAAPAGVIAFWITFVFDLWSHTQLVRALGLAVAGVVAVGSFLLISRWLHIREIGDILATVRRRGPASGSPQPDPLDARSGDPDRSGDSSAADAVVGSTIDPGPPPAVDAEDVPVPIDIDSLTGEPTAPPTEASAPIETPETMVTQAGALSATEQDRTSIASDPTADAERKPAEAPRSAAAGLPAGTVLGARYRLEGVLAECRGPSPGGPSTRSSPAPCWFICSHRAMATRPTCWSSPAGPRSPPMPASCGSSTSSTRAMPRPSTNRPSTNRAPTRPATTSSVSTPVVRSWYDGLGPASVRGWTPTGPGWLQRRR